jgi:DNA-binding transcriptional LysR family regulator
VLAPPLKHTLDQLAVLSAIHRCGTFARAAEDLNRVPSAVSHAVRTLEEQLGVQLFDRSGHRAVLTSAGRRLLEASEEVLSASQLLDRLADQIRTGWEPELQIVVDGALPMEPISRALRAFVQRDIPTRVRVDVEYQEGVPERWETDHAQMMLILDFESEGELLDIVPLPAVDMWLVAAPEHPLSKAGASGRLGRDSLAPFVELAVKDSAPRYSRNPKNTFHRSQHVIYLSDFHSKRLAALAGVGYGWLPGHLIHADLEQKRLLPVALDSGHRWTYHPRLVTRRDEPIGRAGRLFMACLLDTDEVENDSLAR